MENKSKERDLQRDNSRFAFFAQNGRSEIPKEFSVDVAEKVASERLRRIIRK